jgi:hypothetical protein
MRWWLFFACWLCVSLVAEAAGPKVAIVVGEKASSLERRAAEDVSEVLSRLYQAEVSIGTTVAEGAHAIFLGDRKANSSIASLVNDWAASSEQGHVVQSVVYQGKPALVLAGASPMATQWAAAEYSHCLGVRSLLFGDLDPISPPPFHLEGLNIAREPRVKRRGWEFNYDFPDGPAAWSLEEQRRLVRQLGKLKYNQLVLRVSADQPFVHFEADGIKKQTGEFFQGRRFPVSGDTAGRAAFRGAKLFENPDLSGMETYEQRIAAGQTLLRGVIDAAHDAGLMVALAFDPFEVPKEFASVVGDARNARIRLAQSQLKAYQKAYPKIDALCLSIADESATPLLPGLLEGETNDGPEVIVQVAPSLAASLKPITKASRLYDLRTSARRALESQDSWERTGGTHRALVLDLADDRAGVLPQTAHTSLAGLLRTLGKYQWEGFVVRAWNPGELDLSAYFLARGSFDEELTPEQACHELVTPICGEEVSTRVFKALDYLERATTLLDQYEPGFSSPNPKMVMKQLQSADPPPPAWAQAREGYLNAMNEMYRANSRAREGGRAFTLYLARRSEFGFEYLNSIEAVRKAGLAKRKGDAEAHLAELEKAMESMNGALNALAAVARSSSDRGTIAALNAFGYRPLVMAVEAADADQ